MNLFELFNSKCTLKAEVLLNREGKKVCLTIIKIEDGKALDTVQHYIDLPIASVLFEDILTERFWTSKIRYPNGFRDQKEFNGTKRDCLLSKEGNLSIINNVNGEEKKLFFKLTPLQLAALAQCCLNYIKARQLAWALKEK